MKDTTEIWKECSCFEDTNDQLKAMGFRLSAALSYIAMPEFKVVRCLPLEKADGSKMKRTDPKTVTVSHCPFCGNPLSDLSETQQS